MLKSVYDSERMTNHLVSTQLVTSGQVRSQNG
eukprot:SAG11_NODE_42916_length_173_cov_23.189189_1_plen_31_part_01